MSHKEKAIVEFNFTGGTKIDETVEETSNINKGPRPIVGMRFTPVKNKVYKRESISVGCEN